MAEGWDFPGLFLQPLYPSAATIQTPGNKGPKVRGITCSEIAVLQMKSQWECPAAHARGEVACQAGSTLGCQGLIQKLSHNHES